MAEIINDPSDSDDNREEQVEQQQQEVKQEPPKDDLPEKYRGKSPSEIARMHAELEHVVGRQGHELGELRRLADEFIRPPTKAKSDGQADSGTTGSTDDDTELFINPKKYIAKAVEEHPLVKELRASTSKSQAERNRELFAQKHPDSAEILKDPEFRAFVEKSKYRSELFLKAHRDYDLEAGDEIFTLYKEVRAAKAPKQQDDQQQDAGADKAAADAVRRDAVRAGTVPSGNANPAGDGGKKIFRRADLMRMRREDPERYEAMGDEILAAYAEKRVR